MVRTCHWLLWLLLALPLYANEELRIDLDVSNTAAGEPISADVSLSPARPWERQQVRLQVTVLSRDEFPSLRSDEIRLPGFEIVPLPASRKWIDIDGKKWTRLQIGWLLYPLATGKQHIELPGVEYYLGGSRQQRFPLPRLALEVRALPPYIPPTLAVGKLHLDSRVEPDGLLRSGHLAEWIIHMQSDALLPAWFPPVLRQIKSSGPLRFFPANIERRTTPDHDGLHSEVILRIPFKPLGNGKLALPELKFQYFDPDSGQLVDIQHRPASPWTLSLWLQIGLPLLLLALLYRPIHYARQHLRQGLRRRKARRQALACLADADSANAIRQALRQFAHAEGGPQNLSLSAWYRLLAEHYVMNEELRDGLQQLSRVSYGSETSLPLAHLKDRLYRSLSNLKRRSRYGTLFGGMVPRVMRLVSPGRSPH